MTRAPGVGIVTAGTFGTRARVIRHLPGWPGMAVPVSVCGTFARLPQRCQPCPTPLRAVSAIPTVAGGGPPWRPGATAGDYTDRAGASSGYGTCVMGSLLTNWFTAVSHPPYSPDSQHHSGLAGVCQRKCVYVWLPGSTTRWIAYATRLLLDHFFSNLPPLASRSLHEPRPDPDDGRGT